MCRQPVSAILPLKPEFDYEKSRPEFDVIKMDDLSQAASFLKSIISREPIPSYLVVTQMYLSPESEMPFDLLEF